jgi:hypothetical protein
MVMKDVIISKAVQTKMVTHDRPVLRIIRDMLLMDVAESVVEQILAVML